MPRCRKGGLCGRHRRRPVETSADGGSSARQDPSIEGAKAFADYITSSEGQEIIAEFGVEKYSQPLFFPDADKTDAELGLP